ncbi:hypothetical protein D3C85_1582120 [compost metagenome]
MSKRDTRFDVGFAPGPGGFLARVQHHLHAAHPLLVICDHRRPAHTPQFLHQIGFDLNHPLHFSSCRHLIADRYCHRVPDFEIP